MGPYQRTPKEVTGAIRYSGSGVRSVGPVGDFLEYSSTWSSYRGTYEDSWLPHDDAPNGHQGVSVPTLEDHPT